jgi:hypothetical protein
MLFSPSISQTFLRRVIGLLLFVMAWSGPVPALHSHDTCLNDVALHRHVAKFHFGARDIALPAVHWHFAFVNELPGDLLPASFQSPWTTPAVLAASEDFGHHWGHALRELRCPPEWFASHVDRDRLASMAGAFTPRTFLSTMLGEAPMIAVTGVCQI